MYWLCTWWWTCVLEVESLWWWERELAGNMVREGWRTYGGPHQLSIVYKRFNAQKRLYQRPCNDRMICDKNPLFPMMICWEERIVCVFFNFFYYWIWLSFAMGEYFDFFFMFSGWNLQDLSFRMWWSQLGKTWPSHGRWVSRVHPKLKVLKILINRHISPFMLSW